MLSNLVYLFSQIYTSNYLYKRILNSKVRDDKHICPGKTDHLFGGLFWILAKVSEDVHYNYRCHDYATMSIEALVQKSHDPYGLIVGPGSHSRASELTYESDI